MPSGNTSPEQSVQLQEAGYVSQKKPLQFWLVFLGTCMAVFLSALELSSISTALPTIVSDLNGSDFIWVGSAYALSSAAVMPPTGGLSNIFGRRAIMMWSIGFFAMGSAIAGAAQSMNMLIAARAVQGAGGGGIVTLAEIILADMVHLRERGKYSGLLAAVWAVASVIGPVVGGKLASVGQWRWIFYLNLPLSGIAATLVFFFLKLRHPGGSVQENLKRIDWIGNIIIIGSTAAMILSLSWAGVQHSWTSYNVLVPLILGSIGTIGFVLYEAHFPVEPTIPFRLFTNRTTLSGYLVTFFHGTASTLLIYYLPTYFQASKNASAVRAGVLLFPAAFMIAPAAIVSGQIIQRTGKYLTQNYVGWGLTMIGFGILSLLKASSPIAMAEGLQFVVAIGLGIMYNAPNFLVLAALSVEDNAQALALMAYFQTFGQTFGITIGITILQNSLQQHLPNAILTQFPNGAEISYAIIPTIPSLPEPLKSEVKSAFATSIAQIWYACVGVAGVGLICLLPAQAIPLHQNVDEAWGLDAMDPARRPETPEDGGKKATSTTDDAGWQVQREQKNESEGVAADESVGAPSNTIV